MFNIQVKISGEITLKKFLVWPYYGNKYIIISTLNMIAWILFAFYNNWNMAQQMDISSSSKEFIILQVGGIFNLGIFLTRPYRLMAVIHKQFVTS